MKPQNISGSPTLAIAWNTDHYVSAMAEGLRHRGLPRSSHVVKLIPRGHVSSIHIIAMSKDSKSGFGRFCGLTVLLSSRQICSSKRISDSYSKVLCIIVRYRTLSRACSHRLGLMVGQTIMDFRIDRGEWTLTTLGGCAPL